MYQPHVILVPTDFSDNSRYALGVAVDLARQNRASLLLLHVAETPGPEQISFREAETELQPEGYHRRLEGEMHQFAQPLVGDLPVQYAVIEGNPVDEIERFAQDHRCNLIVIGTHGRTGLARLLMGSVAERVVRFAPCPVLTVKLPAAPSGGTTS